MGRTRGSLSGADIVRLRHADRVDFHAWRTALGEVHGEIVAWRDQRLLVRMPCAASIIHRAVGAWPAAPLVAQLRLPDQVLAAPWLSGLCAGDRLALAFVHSSRGQRQVQLNVARQDEQGERARAEPLTITSIDGDVLIRRG